MIIDKPFIDYYSKEIKKDIVFTRSLFLAQKIYPPDNKLIIIAKAFAYETCSNTKYMCEYANDHLFICENEQCMCVKDFNYYFKKINGFLLLLSKYSSHRNHDDFTQNIFIIAFCLYCRFKDLQKYQILHCNNYIFLINVLIMIAHKTYNDSTLCNSVMCKLLDLDLIDFNKIESEIFFRCLECRSTLSKQELENGIELLAEASELSAIQEMN